MKRFVNPARSIQHRNGLTILLLPGGEGWGEGERKFYSTEDIEEPIRTDGTPVPLAACDFLF